MGNPSLSDQEKKGLMQRYRDYASLAESYSNIPNPYLLATTGLSASGKSCVSAALAGELGLIRLRSDVERKRLFGLGPLDNSKSGVGENLYTPEATRDTYQKLCDLARQLLCAGLPVVVDAACLKQQERPCWQKWQRNWAAFALVHCEAPEEKRRAWIRKRNGDASEATEELLDQQKDWFELPTDEEKPIRFICTRSRRTAAAVADRIRQHFGISGE